MHRKAAPPGANPGGRYAMLSRQDGENNQIMFSDNIHFWQTSQIIQTPEHPWEFIQIGNCGSPLETPRGWIVLTHGVGPMRQYCIGAVLLDLENPAKSESPICLAVCVQWDKSCCAPIS